MSVDNELKQALLHVEEARRQIKASTKGIKNARDGRAVLHPNRAQAAAAANILRCFCENRPGPTGCNDCLFADLNEYGGSACKLDVTPNQYPVFIVKGIQ